MNRPLNKNSQTAEVVREIVRYIYKIGLRGGDKLPTEAALKAHFGFCNTTLQAAMNSLVESGVVTRKRRSGTFLCDTDQKVRGLWNVGIVTLSMQTMCEPVYSQLLHLLHRCLGAESVAVSDYNRLSTAPEGPRALGDFGFLATDIANKKLDVVISMAALEKEDWSAHLQAGLPLVHVGAWEDAPCGVIIDQEKMASDAVALLVRNGCRRLGVVSASGHNGGKMRFWKGFTAGISKFGLALDERNYLHQGHGLGAGISVADELLRRPVSKRPDGLLVIDDRIAAGLASRLVQTPGYRPSLAVQTNKQSPLVFALPVFHFDLDIQELAKKAVEMAMERLLDPVTPMRQEWISPKQLCGEQPHLIGSK